MTRSLARAAAMKLIYEWEMGGCGGEDTRLDLLEIEPGEEESDYMDAVVQGVKDHVEELDELIGAHAKGWSLQRIGRVDLSIMRVAVYEMKFTDLPPASAIDEALELTKEYVSPEAVPFVNGVLGSVARSL